MKLERRCPDRWILVILLWSLPLLFSGCTKEHPGQAVYQEKCSQCHGSSGQGLRNLYPPLEKSPYLSNQIEELPCLIIQGSRGAINTAGRPRSRFMPPIDSISTSDMLTLLDFLQKRWTSESTGPTLPELERWLLSCKS